MGRGGQRHEFPVLLQHIPDFRQGGVTLKYVKRGYHVLCTHALTLLLLPLAATVLLELANMLKTGQLREMWVVASQTHLQFNMVVFMGCCLLLAIMAVTYVLTRTKPVYLINYHCYKPPDSLKMSRDRFTNLSIKSQMFNEQSLQFQEKIMERSGLGDETYLPEAVQQIPPQISMAAAREEAEMVLFDSVRNVLEEAKLKPGQVDILVVNCSLFNPTPSLSAMIINHFKMRSNIVSYNLAGMGCSAGVIAVNLAKELLQVYPGSRALVVSTENITQNWYFGNERSMLIPNCLFRVGGAALLLSNKYACLTLLQYTDCVPQLILYPMPLQNLQPSRQLSAYLSLMQRNLSSFADTCIARACLDGSFASHGCFVACCADLAFLGCYTRKDYWRAKYELLHVVRTHMGANDQRYGCVYQREDSKGRVGVHLSKELMAIAGHALKANITTLGPLVLPISEQLIFFGNLVARKVFKMKIKGYIPDFKLAFEHFCIHTGGRGVIEEIEKQLQLAPDNVQPSKDTLFRYGNTSSSSIWYVLSNIESKRGIRKGDRIWQIAFGSGFKCNSAVWRSMRNNNQQHTAWDDTPKPVEP